MERYRVVFESAKGSVPYGTYGDIRNAVGRLGYMTNQLRQEGFYCDERTGRVWSEGQLVGTLKMIGDEVDAAPEEAVRFAERAGFDCC